MRWLLVPILIPLLLISGLIVGCSETTTERDSAVAFYKGAYPIGKEIRDVADDWNVFLDAVEQGASDKEIVGMCSECQSGLEALQYDLSLLYAPPSLRELKDDIALCLTTGVEGFVLEQQCIVKHNINYCIQGDEKIIRT